MTRNPSPKSHTLPNFYFESYNHAPSLIGSLRHQVNNPTTTLPLCVWDGFVMRQ